ncbi:HTH domain-containing protein [Candidatus Woesearchaeota archaeon]|nr:HTH domain-containing protein [Candidatus Woesearchaeota archaeon]
MGDKEKIFDLLISSDGPMDVASICKKTGLSQRTVRAALKQMEEEGAPLEKTKKKNKKLFNVSENLEDRILASDYEYLRTTAQKPLKIVSGNGDFSLAFANTLYAGAKTDKTLFQNFLKYCNSREVDALIITGNTFYIDSMRFSKYAVDRARITEQPERSKSDLRSKYDDGLFLDLEERLELSRSLLTDLFNDKEGNPLYNGQIYVTFGEAEENLVRQHTVQLVKYKTFQKRAELKNMISEFKAEKRKIRAAENKRNTKADDESDDFDSDDDLVDTLEQLRDIEEVNDDIMDVEQELAKTTMSNLDKNEVKKIEDRVLGFLVNYLESAIPNSTVIPAGEGYFKANGKKIKVKYSSKKHSNAASDNLMSSLIGSERRHLASGKTIEDVIVQGGMSTTYTKNLLPYMSAEGEKESLLIQLPTCLDRLDLEQKLKHAVLAKDPLTNLASKSDFMTGAVILQNIDGINKTQLCQGGFLTNSEIKFDNYTPKMFYEIDTSDDHAGSSYMALIITKDGVTPAYVVSYQFMEKNKIPAVRLNHLGDVLQEKNYDTELEEHQDHKTPKELEKELAKLKNPKDIIKLQKINAYRAGIIVPEKQMEEYMQEMPLEFIKQVIKNADEIGLVGPRVMIIPGNHTMHTFEGLMNPERQIARQLRLMLGIKDEDNIIISPMLGKIGHYENEFGVKDGYMYAETNIHKHGGSKYNDPLRVVRKTYGQMGRPSRHAEKKFVINRSGHTHFGGETSSTDAHHIQCFCFQDSNQYGAERQYPSPTVEGFKIIGFPRDGPLYGPIVGIDVPISYLRKWAQSKRQINTEKLFNDSIV